MREVWEDLDLETPEEKLERAYEEGVLTRPVRVENLDTGEIYSSLTEAGRALGYLSSLKIPPRLREKGGCFQARGHNLKLVP